jgi:hypothetical protein
MSIILSVSGISIFKDHLKPLNGLFGFDLTMDTYNGVRDIWLAMPRND